MSELVSLLEISEAVGVTVPELARRAGHAVTTDWRGGLAVSSEVAARLNAEATADNDRDSRIRLAFGRYMEDRPRRRAAAVGSAASFATRASTCACTPANRTAPPRGPERRPR